MPYEIGWHDLEFERVPIEWRSTAGVPYTRWISTGMPFIPQSIVRDVFYLYRDEADARAGQNPGGTGFIVRYDGTFRDQVPGHHFYAVTNWHVACDRGYSTIRLNTKDGGIDIVELDSSEWHFIPGKYDVAVVPITLDDKVHDVSSISTNQFLWPASGKGRRRDYAGLGDDVFMVGLFIDHNGTGVNVPSARFGNVSMLPNPKALIKQPTQFMGESFVIDMHSRTGFSGSPVFVYRTFGSDLTEPWGTEFDRLEIDNWPTEINIYSGGAPTGPVRGRIRANTLFKLLGINWGQFPERWELRGKDSLAEARRDLIVEGGYVEGMSGMTCVIPAWHIMEVFDMPKLKKLRHPVIAAAERAKASEPRAEAAPPANGENPTHREDFTRLVGAAARRPAQED